MPLVERELDAYECPTCGQIWLREEEMCCGEPLDTVDATAVFEPPELKAVTTTVFGMGTTEIAVCVALMTVGDATVNELTTQFSHARSTTQRHLAHLVELGVVEKQSQVLLEGGRANVYSIRSADEIYHQLRLNLYAWLAAAEDQLEELNREKFEAMAERTDGETADESESHSEGGTHDRSP